MSEKSIIDAESKLSRIKAIADALGSIRLNELENKDSIKFLADMIYQLMGDVADILFDKDANLNAFRSSGDEITEEMRKTLVLKMCRIKAIADTLMNDNCDLDSSDFVGYLADMASELVVEVKAIVFPSKQAVKNG